MMIALVIVGIFVGVILGNYIADLVFPKLCPIFDKIMSKRVKANDRVAALGEQNERLYTRF